MGYKDKSKKIFERDFYLCKYCGITVKTVSNIYQEVDIIQKSIFDLYLNKKINRRQYLSKSDTTIIFKGLYKKYFKLLATIDHIIARANGGSDEDNNLTTCCFVCNAKKGKNGKPSTR